MKTVRLFCNENSAEHLSQSKFYYLFNHLINKFEKCYWILTKDSFRLPIDWYPDDIESSGNELLEFDSAIITEAKEYMLVSNAFIQKYGEYVRDDWNELLCYTGEEWHFNEILSNINDSMDLKSFVIKQCTIPGLKIEIFFSNWDSMYWEVISKDDLYINSIKDRIKKNSTVSIEEV